MNRMEDSSKNNFDKRGGELMPRELMERAASMFADTAYTVNLILTAVILQMESSGRGGKRAGMGPARGAACARGRDA